MSARRAGGVLLLLLGACAFEAGNGFATLETGELRAAFEADAARDLGDGVVLTDRGYRVRIEALTLQAEELALLQAGEGDGSFTEMVRVPIDRELDLLAGEETEFGPGEPSAELGAAAIDRAELRLSRLVVTAVVEGGELQEPREVAATVDVREPLAVPLALRLDRDAPARLTPEVQLHTDATLFDGVEFDALDDSALERIMGARLLDWVAEAQLTVDLGVGEGGHGQGREEGDEH